MISQTANSESPRRTLTNPRGAGRKPGSKPGKLEKEQLERLLGSMLKSRETPIQYKSGLAGVLSSLKGWGRQGIDDSTKLDMSAHLRRWSAERIYASPAGRMVSSDSLLAAGASGEPGAGGIPQEQAQTEALVPSHTPHTPENLQLTVDNTEVKEKGGA